MNEFDPRFEPRAGLHNALVLPLRKQDEAPWLTFDLETHAWPKGEDHRRDLGVTCLALAIGESVYHRPAFAGGFAPQMSKRELGLFVQDLYDYAAEGYKIATINGPGFDFPVLVAAVPEMRDTLRALALDSYDPAFQMLCEKGFMVGLDALAVGLELAERKTEDMSGALAVTMWESGDLDEQRKVIEYVRQDARVTLQIMRALENKRWTWVSYWDGEFFNRQAIRWLTKAGKISHHCLENGLLTVRECLELPLPDVSWMKKRGMEPWSRDKFTGWLNG